jgi:hypothetical protein
MVDILNAYKIVVEKPKGKTSFVRSRCRWDDTIKIDLKEIGYGSVNSINVAHNSDQWWTLENTAMFI